MSNILINTIVQHYVCRIFQDTARMLGVLVITVEGEDAGRLKQAAGELEAVLTHYVQSHAASRKLAS